MRIKKKVFFSLMLFFLFSVAVSGGCGGGGGGHYSGNFGNSSQDVTPPSTPESQDVTPQNPTSGDQNGDDYGDGNDLNDWAVISNDLTEINLLFNALNNTVWEIENIEVQVSHRNAYGYQERNCTLVENSRNYNNFTKLKLNTEESGLMTWTDINKTTNHETPHFDDLTIQVIDPFNNRQDTALLIRAATNFEFDHESSGIYNYEATQGPSFSGDESDSEHNRELLWISAKQNKNTLEYVFTQLIIVNDYYLSDDMYYYPTRSYLTLSPAKIENVQSEDIAPFSSLNNTVWEIESMQVQTMQGNETVCQIVDNSLNFNNFTKLKLTAQDDGTMVWWTIDNTTNAETYHFDDLTAQFVNPRTNQTQTALLIRTANNFRIGDDRQGYEATQGPSFTNKEYDIEQIFRTEDNKLGIMNVFYIGEEPFMSSMILAPAN